MKLSLAAKGLFVTLLMHRLEAVDLKSCAKLLHIDKRTLHKLLKELADMDYFCLQEMRVVNRDKFLQSLRFCSEPTQTNQKETDHKMYESIQKMYEDVQNNAIEIQKMYKAMQKMFAPIQKMLDENLDTYHLTPNSVYNNIYKYIYNTNKEKKETNKEKKESFFRNDAKNVLAFLNKKTHRMFRPVPANLNLIVARLKSGVTVQECKMVIALKCREWSNDEKMFGYLRPATLFNATKFEQYLGELAQQEEENSHGKTHVPRL